ncbi:MAG: hypothetical protein M1830_010017 [Pleopsidium flavum]|nr:MAG: hypothetical protein M1830_010017 [Pleopsidium flavum]
MTSLNITDADIPDLTGKVAIITGAASGIGLAAAHILAAHGTTVHALDISPPHPEDPPSPPNVYHTICDVASWPALLAEFTRIGHVDIAIANAGVSQECDYFANSFDSNGQLEEPKYNVLNVNLRAVLNFVKLSMWAFKKQCPGGSLVITASATAYSPEQSLPVYSATKLALVGLVRALRSTITASHGATINLVAPAATITRLLPADLAKPIVTAGAPVSSAMHVGLALAYSATANQAHQVETYGRDPAETVSAPGRWNGRTILTLGEKYTELEEPIASLRSNWFGEYNTEMTAFQQKLTDMRPHIALPN